MADHAAYFALLDVERTDPEVADVLAEGAGVYLDDVRRLVEDGQRAGTIADAPSDLIAVGVLGTVSSFSNSYRNGRLGRRHHGRRTRRVRAALGGQRPELTAGYDWSGSRRGYRAITT